MSRRSRQRQLAQQLKRGDTYSRDDGIDWGAIAMSTAQQPRPEHDRNHHTQGQQTQRATETRS